MKKDTFYKVTIIIGFENLKPLEMRIDINFQKNYY